MPDILLIQPPIQDFYLTAKRTVPYWLASIAAAARQAGFSASILDGLATDKSRTIPWPAALTDLTPFYGRIDRSPFGLFHHFRHYGYSIDHIATQARSSGAWLIGISSLFTAYSDTALELAEAVKKRCPRTVIVLGGHHPTALPEAVIGHPAVDYVLRGDGEVGLPLLARCLKEGKSPDGVPGLVRLASDGRLEKSSPAVAEDLNRLPMPALDLINWRYYQRGGRSSVTVTAARGCPHRCTYCAVNATTYHGYRKRSVASVMDELREANQMSPIGFIDFEDEHLTADRSWFMTLLAALKEEFGGAGIELRAMNGLFAPALDEEMIRHMQQAGFRTINLALITTHPPQLKRFGRPNISTEIDRVIRQAALAGMNSVAYLIVAGPQQTPFTSVQDLLFLAERPVLAGVSVFYPAPGSADYDWCNRRGLLPGQFLQMRSTALPLAHLTSQQESATLLRLGRILNFMKSCLERGQSLPKPSSPPAVTSETDRQAIGRMLLAAFLADGNIYGVDQQGEVYPHTADPQLCRLFLRGLGHLTLKGSIIRD